MKINWKQTDITADNLVLTTIDAHAAGEPLRIVTGGLPDLPGSTILEKRRYMQEHYDHIRKALMWEPRGHRDMYGCIITEPVTAHADLGVLFMHNEGYSTMCGHGIIALVTTLLNTGAYPSKGQHTPINIDTPAGLVRAVGHLDASGRVEYVSFQNVASFLYARDVELEVSPYGKLKADIAFGGAFYAILPAQQVGLQIEPQQRDQLVIAGEAVKKAVNEKLSIKHPFEEDLGFLYGTIFTGPPEDPAHHSRNVCIFADAEVDRSPTGTGVSARLALHHAKDELVEGQQITIESILGSDSAFGGKVASQTKVGEYEAIVPEVSGTAFITGQHEFIVESSDKLGKEGFIL